MSSSVPDDHPKDDKIPHRTVRIVAQDGVGPPTSLSTILAAIDRKNFFVELVSHHKETGALVKIIDKRERARWLKEQKQRKWPICRLILSRCSTDWKECHPW